MGKTVNFKGNLLELEGGEIKVGQIAPNFTLTAQDMSDIHSKDLVGKVIVLSLIPSIDTPVCSIETKKFNGEFDKLNKSEAMCLTVSMDLPFAQKRWCGTEGITSVILASDYKYRSISSNYGALIKDWGLLTRAVFVIDKSGKIIHAQYVEEVSSEPDYISVMQSVNGAL